MEQKKIDFLLELIACSHQIYYWHYDGEMNLIRTTSKDERTLSRCLYVDPVRRQRVLDYFAEQDLPLISSAPIGLVWACVAEKADGELRGIHILGPVYPNDMSLQAIEDSLNRYQIHMRFRRRLVQQLASLTVMPINTFFSYVKMLHFCVTGQHVNASDFAYDRTDEAIVTEPKKWSYLDEDVPEEHTRHAGVYAAEQKLFKMIEEGNVNYADALNNAVDKCTYGSLSYADSDQKSLATSITFITLSVRAAIRGGLAPSIAYSVGDSYEEQVAKCTNMTERKRILDTMFDDFVHRVRKVRLNPQVSKPIQVCCDYIDLHIYDKFELEDLADMVGYTKYYLTRKFKTELGIGIWDYINQRKVERAKILLADPNYSIQDISDMLNYCSRSYFSEVFQECTGFRPSNYRAIELKM